MEGMFFFKNLCVHRWEKGMNSWDLMSFFPQIVVQFLQILVTQINTLLNRISLAF
jgi:hypothetical protein